MLNVKKVQTVMPKLVKVDESLNKVIENKVAKFLKPDAPVFEEVCTSKPYPYFSPYTPVNTNEVQTPHIIDFIF